MEVETKLDVHPAFVLPDLAGAVGGSDVVDEGETTLRATYWDTEDLRLARAGVTLRHRRSGSSGSWQVKIGAEGGDDDALARAELDFPGGPTRPPRNVREQVAVAARGGDLLPVARLTTRRRTLVIQREGETVAEVVDDEVSILHEGRIASRFRELEVELGPGGTARDRRSLVATLTAEGARANEQAPKVMRALGPGADEPDDLSRFADPVVAEVIAPRLARLRAVDPAARRDDPGAAEALADLLDDLALAADLIAASGEPGHGSTPEAQIWLAAAASAREVASIDESRSALAQVLDDVRGAGHGRVPVPSEVPQALDDALAARRDAARAALCSRLADEEYVAAVAGLTEAAMAGALRARGDHVPAAEHAWRASADDASSAPRFAIAVELVSAAQERPLGRLPARAARFSDAARRHETARRALEAVLEVAEAIDGRAAFAAGLAAAGLADRAARLHDQVAAARADADGKRLRRLLGHADEG